MHVKYQHHLTLLLTPTTSIDTTINSNVKSISKPSTPPSLSTAFVLSWALWGSSPRRRRTRTGRAVWGRCTHWGGGDDIDGDDDGCASVDDGGDGGIDDCTIVDDTNVSDGTGVDEREKKRRKTVAMITEEEWSHRQRVHPPHTTCVVPSAAVCPQHSPRTPRTTSSDHDAVRWCDMRWDDMWDGDLRWDEMTRWR